jgi:hypothetical protein
VKVDTGIGSAAVSGESGYKNRAIGEGDRDTEVVCKGTSDEDTPRETKPLEPSAESNQQWLKRQIEQERSKGVPLTDPASHRHRANRVIVVHEKGGSVGVSNRKGVLEKGGEAELGKNRGEIRVRDPVVGFFLVKEDQRTVHREIVKILFGGVTQDVTNSHCDISGLTTTDKASLMGRNELRKNSRKAGSKYPRKDLDIAVGKRDRTPIGNVREITAGFRDQRDKCARPGRRRRASRQDGVEQREKNREKRFGKRLVPFIRDPIRARGLAWG